MVGKAHEPEPSLGLDDWVTATWSDAVAYANSLLHDIHAAEDVVHDSYVNLLRKARDYDLPRDGVKLLFKSVTNACFKRKARARPWFRLTVRGPDDEDRQQEVADPRAVAPSRGLLDRELRERVAHGLERLPPMQRAALELKSLDHSLADIAATLGTTPGNVGVLIHRAREALARMLTPYLEGHAP